jgi:hypothetical protein
VQKKKKRNLLGAACLWPDLERLKIFNAKTHRTFVLNILRHLLKSKVYQTWPEKENALDFGTGIEAQSHVHRVTATVMNARSFTSIYPMNVDEVDDSTFENNK